jgi:hypothetical protein
MEFLRESGLGWRHHIEAKSAFIDRNNIKALITGSGIEGDIGLLSIDLDGNLLGDGGNRRGLARILVVEYNSVFGPEVAVTIPYDPLFVRGRRTPRGSTGRRHSPRSLI